MIDRRRLAELRASEEGRFLDLHPRSAALAEEARGPLLAGVPMPWMTRWPGAFPVFFDSAYGARLTDVDGIEYVDLCLGDTGAMTGHALPQVAEAIARQARGRASPPCCPRRTRPGSARSWPAASGCRTWQLAMSATDANRFVLRFARHLTGRPRIAVMDWCYHGTVDETLAVLDGDRVVPRPGALGPQVDVAADHGRGAVQRPRRPGAGVSAEGDVACLLMEPALTNIGIVLPDDGYLDGVREVTRRHGVLLVIDETHTLCAGPGRVHPRLGTRARLRGGGQADRRRRPVGGVRHDRARSPSGCPVRCSATRSTSPGSVAR